MPPWIPARAFIDYVTGAFLMGSGVCFLVARKTRIASAYAGAWIVLLVVVIYGPVLIGALADPNTGVKIEGLNYFADTLLFGGAILSLAGANQE
jgi:ABC-type antimicrobial peptide transport system permease subunit